MKQDLDLEFETVSASSFGSGYRLVYVPGFETGLTSIEKFVTEIDAPDPRILHCQVFGLSNSDLPKEITKCFWYQIYVCIGC